MNSKNNYKKIHRNINLVKVEERVFFNELKIKKLFEQDNNLDSLQDILDDINTINSQIVTINSNINTNTNNISTNTNNISTNTNDILDLRDEVSNLDSGNNYTNTETVIGTWVDGKPIYRNMFSFTVPVGTNTVNIQVQDIGILISCIAKEINSDKSYVPVVSKAELSDNIEVQSVPVSSLNNVSITLDNNLSQSVDISMFIEYTKTTD